MNELKRTPIYSEYEKHGAKTINFGGWDLPVQFKGIKHEHEVTRTKAGLFDVSHMGQIEVKGSKSLEFLQFIVTNDVSKLSPKQAQYTMMCYEDGGIVDDFLIYMLDKEHYLLVVNASNTRKDHDWLVKYNRYHDEVSIKNVSDDYVLIALQGPKSEAILQTVTQSNLKDIEFFHFENPVYFKSIQQPAMISRTGYTGEDGFEIYIHQASGRELWNLLLNAGKDCGLEPIGLGARDTLRFEVGLPLYGQELTPEITPIEAGLDFVVKINKEEDFIGKKKLKIQFDHEPMRKIVGIEMVDKGIPRHGYDVSAGEEDIGFVTSGTQLPTIKRNVGLALIKSKYTEIGTELCVQIRNKKLKAVVVETPFYQTAK